MTNKIIQKIETLVKDNFGVVETFDGVLSKNITKEPANDLEIANSDTYFNNKIPHDYLNFLKKYNGIVLFDVAGISGFKFFGCQELILENKFQKENLGIQWDDNILLICSCLGDGDFIGLNITSKNSYEIVDCFNEEIPSNWASINGSFEFFLEKIIDEKGRKFWLG